MTTILLVIMGVLLAAAAVLFIVYYGGDAFGNGRVEAEAGRLVGEGAQMEAALELFYRQEGHYPTSDDPVAELIAAGYLTHAPLGTRTQEKDRWAVDYAAGMIRAKLGDTASEDSLAICTKAREQLDLPSTGTSTGIYRCDGTDSPGGRLGGREPCCIGEVGVGGGAASSQPSGPENIYANSCNGIGSIPVGTVAQQAAYISQASQCAAGIVIPADRASTAGVVDALVKPPIQGTFLGSVTAGFLSNGEVEIVVPLPDANKKLICREFKVLGSRNEANPGADEYCIEGSYTATYYRRITDAIQTYRYEILQRELARIASSAASIAQVDKDVYSARGGYQPKYNNEAASWDFVKEGSPKVTARFDLGNDYREYLCEWLGRQSGWTYVGSGKDAYDSGSLRCGYTGDYLEVDITESYRSKQRDHLVAELGRIHQSVESTGEAEDAAYVAAGGYQPSYNNYAESWSFVGSQIRTARIMIGNNYREYLCEWLSQKGWAKENLNDAYISGNMRCHYTYDYIEVDVNDTYRAAQRDHLLSEMQKTLDSLALTGATSKSAHVAAGGYQPNLRAYAESWDVKNSGNQVYIYLGNNSREYLCEWLGKNGWPKVNLNDSYELGKSRCGYTADYIYLNR